eukprot:6687508-Alexandrium_andersonii.AAC.1
MAPMRPPSPARTACTMAAVPPPRAWGAASVPSATSAETAANARSSSPTRCRERPAASSAESNASW